MADNTRFALLLVHDECNPYDPMSWFGSAPAGGNDRYFTTTQIVVETPYWFSKQEVRILRWHISPEPDGPFANQKAALLELQRIAVPPSRFTDRIDAGVGVHFLWHDRRASRAWASMYHKASSSLNALIDLIDKLEKQGYRFEEANPLFPSSS
jgi:hypothetical protein